MNSVLSRSVDESVTYSRKFLDVIGWWAVYLSHYDIMNITIGFCWLKKALQMTMPDCAPLRPSQSPDDPGRCQRALLHFIPLFPNACGR